MANKDDRGGQAGSLTRAQLVSRVHRRNGGLTIEEASEAVNAVLAGMKTSLLDGRAVKIRNFGVFDIIERSKRQGVSPSDGQPISIPSHRGLQFRPADGLKKAVDATARPRPDRA